MNLLWSMINIMNEREWKGQKWRTGVITGYHVHNSLHFRWLLVNECKGMCFATFVSGK